MAKVSVAHKNHFLFLSGLHMFVYGSNGAKLNLAKFSYSLRFHEIYIMRKLILKISALSSFKLSFKLLKYLAIFTL